MISTLENSSARLSVSTAGAELQSFILKETGFEYIWQADPQYWQRRAPILFPFVGKLKNGQYEYDGSVYSMSGHGFARDKEFTLVSQTDDTLTYQLKYDEETLQVYPFKFRLTVTYKLTHATVEIGWKVENLDKNGEMFFSIGAHPAFNCPIGSDRFDDHEIEFDQTEQSPLKSWQLNSAGLFDGSSTPISLVYGKVLRLNHDLFMDDALVFKNLYSESVKLKNPFNHHFVKVDFKGFPYLGIWTKPHRAPFICIEPWYGLADSTQKCDLPAKEGIQRLPAKGAFNATHSITIG